MANRSDMSAISTVIKRKMVSEDLFTKMAMITKANGKMTRKMEREYIDYVMAMYMRASSKTECDVGKEYINMLPELFTPANFSTTKCMATGHMFTLVASNISAPL